MIVAIDVSYNDADSTALAAAVIFHKWNDESCTHIQNIINGVRPYESGFFYKRELPCIIEILRAFNLGPEDCIIVDGYVDLEPGHQGLGRYVYDYYDKIIPVIGVAKTKYQNSQALEVCRGESKTPLYITAAGIDLKTAANHIKQMHGPYRIPTLLKKVDQLSRVQIAL